MTPDLFSQDCFLCNKSIPLPLFEAHVAQCAEQNNDAANKDHTSQKSKASISSTSRSNPAHFTGPSFTSMRGLCDHSFFNWVEYEKPRLRVNLKQKLKQGLKQKTGWRRWKMNRMPAMMKRMNLRYCGIPGFSSDFPR